MKMLDYFLSFLFFRFEALKNLLTGDIPPSKVIEKNLESIANYNVLQRDDSMVLYAPPIQTEATSRIKQTFEIVLFRPTTETVNSSYRFVINLHSLIHFNQLTFTFSQSSVYTAHKPKKKL